MGLIFSAQHDPTTVVRVIHGRSPDGGKGLDIVVNGRLRERVFNPAEVTKWFENNSKANLPKWQKAYHTSGLNADDFKRPVISSATDITLPVRYLNQRDNERHPFGSCNVTCYAMAMAYLGVKRRKSSYRQFEDELEKFLVSNGRDRHVHDDLAWMGRQYGLDATFRTDRTLDEIRHEIRSGRPVIVSTVLTRSGHIILLIGTKGDDFVVHDPFGNALKNYRDHDGEGLVYSGELMKRKMRNPSSTMKWAHFLRRRDEGD
jgi:hypothetical protein